MVTALHVSFVVGYTEQGGDNSWAWRRGPRPADLDRVLRAELDAGPVVRKGVVTPPGEALAMAVKSLSAHLH